MFSIFARAFRPALLLLPLLVPLAGCGRDSTGPGDESGSAPGINIVAGANITDTIDAPMTQALRIVVRDESKRILPGEVVRFSSVMVVGPEGWKVPTVLVGALSTAGATTFLAETTSAEGAVSVRVVMGHAAGSGAVAIEVPNAGLVDTARYTIMPGAAVRVVLPIVDTTIQVGRTMALAGRVTDRNGNARADAVTYKVEGTGLSVKDGQMTSSAPARSLVIGRLAGGSLTPDTTKVSVVPAAKIAIRRESRLMIGGLDGTDLTEIPHALDATGYGLEWHPDGQSLLAVLGTYSAGYSLYRVGLDGVTQQLIASSTPVSGGGGRLGVIRGFAYSPDAYWVYVTGNYCNYNAVLYRFPVADPEAIERLSPTGMDECFELVNHWPSPSPDGARLTFENQTWNQSGYSVKIMTVATGEITELVAGGQHPQWSPAGDLIAYWADDQIWVVRSDGTGARAISPAVHVYIPGVHWSPDGKWILARFEPIQGWAGTTVALIEVSTGLEIPIPWTTAYAVFGLPAWRPGP